MELNAKWKCLALIIITMLPWRQRILSNTFSHWFAHLLTDISINPSGVKTGKWYNLCNLILHNIFVKIKTPPTSLLCVLHRSTGLLAACLISFQKVCLQLYLLGEWREDSWAVPKSSSEHLHRNQKATETTALCSDLAGCLTWSSVPLEMPYSETDTLPHWVFFT